MQDQQLPGMPTVPRVDPRIIRAADRDDVRIEEIKVSGWLSVDVSRREDPLFMRDRVTIAIHDEDGRVVATGMAKLEGGGHHDESRDGVTLIAKRWTAKVSHF